jgi:hypothetical protein
VPPSLHGVPRDGSPASSVIQSTPTSCRPSRVTSFPSLRGTAAAPWVSFPQTQGATTAGQGLLTGLPHTGFIGGDDRTSQVPGGPRYERALFFDPGGIFALGRYRASMLPSAFTTASASAISIISGLNHTARSLAVYASQGELPHHHARLASGWLASLSGRELATRWVPTKGFRLFHSPFPGFAWRTVKVHESDVYRKPAPRRRFVKLFRESFIHLPRYLWRPRLVIHDSVKRQKGPSSWEQS